MITSAAATMAQARAQSAALRHRIIEALTESRLMTATISAFMILYMSAAYLLVRKGLEFVHAVHLLGPVLIERLLFLLFFFFFLMLVLSNAAITGIGLFRRQETGWHLSLPMPHGSLVMWKTIEGLMLSSWGLLLLSAPILAGFSFVFQAGWEFYLFSFVAIVCLISIASNVSTWLLLLVVRFYRPWWLKVSGVILGILVINVVLQIREAQSVKLMSADVAANVNQILRHTKICSHPLLPSAWVAETVIATGKGLQSRAIFYGLTLLSHALMVWLITNWLANKLFYKTWNKALNRAEQRKIDLASTTFGVRRRSGAGIFAKLLSRKRNTRALICKDALTFMREPMQWGQCALIFGLLLLYTSNLRNLGYNYKDPLWSSIISYLNLSVCCLAMSTLTTRFVFPQFSLEGQRLWILGLAPFPLTKVLNQRLYLNLVAVTPMTTLLVMISCFSLKLPFHRAAFFIAAILLLTVGLNALALALGTLLPNLKETNSAKIVSGFGGTLCLVLSFFYIVISMVVLVVPTVMDRRAKEGLPLDKLLLWELAALGVVFIVTVIAGGVPYFFALKKTKELANLGNP
jgi:ABC-2 type transport system permease protein